MKPNEAVLMLAGRIQETCTEAMLEWGAAANAAEDDPKNEALVLIARERGRLALRLAMGIAKKLGRKA
jgi:hypothetical protein